MGWLFIKKHPAIVEAGKKLNYDDLANDSLVVFQKKTGKRTGPTSFVSFKFSLSNFFDIFVSYYLIICEFLPS
jgi:hypothetical protein